ncbi:PorT family protein [Bdellovibrio sp. SKB1291214]|uniref:outer membrane beta-barrel protein n=1 Tax=Bdellovibrio sp. SKB1291214 TaxID=1732569 RepID=UPI000B515B95|nr:outer membrane beta-barrel protein [Bdellovibrio sp. SKB1291214]UYL10319.1 PorT family protein [Bdellovibrio sp. SKB1291214]
MKKLALSLLVASGLFSSAAFADLNYGVELGVRSQSGDTDTAVASTDSKTAMQFGVFGIMPISGAWNLRTGLLYTQRPLIVKSAGLENNIDMNYVDIPLNIMYKFEDYAGVYLGVNLGINMDKKCSLAGCTMSDVTSPLIPLTVGAAFKFAPNFGVNFYFESASGKVVTVNNSDLKNYRAIGANLILTFD